MALGLVNEIVPKSEVYDRALEIAEQLAGKPQLFLRYTTLALRQRLLQRLNGGTKLGMALEGLTAADIAYQPPDGLGVNDHTSACAPLPRGAHTAGAPPCASTAASQSSRCRP